MRYARTLGLAAALLLCASARGEEGREERREGEIDLRTERVVVFKDGHCLFIKRATGVADPKGEVFTERVPDSAVLGSFWAVAERGKLVSMSAGFVETKEETFESVPCTQHIEVLKANVDKRCTVDMTFGKTYEGEIRGVLATETDVAAPQPLVSRLQETWRFARADLAPALRVEATSGSYFVLTTDDGDVVLPVGQIRALTVKDMELTNVRKVTAKRTTKRLTFRLDRPKSRCELAIMYFTPGIRWIPTYRVELAPDGAEKKTARIALQAEILNEVEDLEDVFFDLVVGEPHFRFKDTISPLSLERQIRNALQAAAPQLMGQMMAMPNVSFASRSGERHSPRRRPVGGGAGSVTLPKELTAGGKHDLFVYSLPKLSLKKGHRAAVGIFDATAPYRDVYTWELRVKRRDIETSPSAGASPLVIEKNQVWHRVELENGTDVPWTTGAAMLMQGNTPLAQELLTYTSRGGSVRVPVTVSVDTRGTFGEEETGRELKVITWERYHYARIAKAASLRLTNMKREAVDVEITCHLGGKAERASDEGRIAIGAFDGKDWDNYRGSAAVNNHSTIFWRTSIEPGKVFTPSVDYHYFTRH